MMMVMRSPIAAAPSPGRAVPRTVPRAVITGVETAPSPIESPIRTVPGRIGPPRAIAIPGIVPTGIPRRSPSPRAYVYIKIHVGLSVRIVRIVSVSVVSVAQIQIDLVGPGDRNFTGRMIPDDPFGIFGIRTALGSVLPLYGLFGIRFIGVIRLLHIDGSRPAVIFVDVPFARRRGGTSDGRYQRPIFFRLYDFFLFYFFFFLAFAGREIYIIKKLLLGHCAECYQEHHHQRC